MPNCYAFCDKKTGVLSNHFITEEPFEKVKQNISVSLLQLSMKEPTNPFVLFANDYELCWVCHVECLNQDIAGSSDEVDQRASLSYLLTASRRAFNAGNDQTSPNADLDKSLE